ncbi:MAG: hypothetical protein AVDCRST_MAG93-4576, partial [uncultured Chloroflexia bacterium]
ELWTGSCRTPSYDSDDWQHKQQTDEA